MGSYYGIVTCRNSDDNIEKAILSLEDQSLKPEYIITIDDGSTDNTPLILKELQKRFSNLHIITNPDLGYDIKRVVNNWNKAIKLTIERELKETDYHMIGTDDTIYEKNYAEKILLCSPDVEVDWICHIWMSIIPTPKLTIYGYLLYHTIKHYVKR